MATVTGRVKSITLLERKNNFYYLKITEKNGKETVFLVPSQMVRGFQYEAGEFYSTTITLAIDRLIDDDGYVK